MAIMGQWNRRTATGVNAALVTLFAIVIASLLVDLSHRYRLRLDTSANAEATLKEDTIAALNQAEESGKQVEIVAFTSQRRNAEARYRNRMMRDLLRELSFQSKAVETRFVDLDLERSVAEELEVTSYGTIVVRQGGDRVDIKEREVFKRLKGGKTDVPNLEFRGEALIARAVSQVIAGERKVIYLLEGHGEVTAKVAGQDGILRFLQLMERQGWDVESLNLLRDRKEGEPPAVPEDASALLVLAPSAAMAVAEEEALRAFLSNGGGLGVFLEPGAQPPLLLERLGIRMSSGTVRDHEAVWPHEDWPLLRYGRHLIVDELLQGEISTLVARAAAVDVDAREGISPHDIMLTSRRGWVERGRERPAEYTVGEDIEGPVKVVVAVDVSPISGFVQKAKMGRVLVSGDTSLLTDELMEQLGNSTLAINSVRWLAGDESRMSLVGRPTRLRGLTMGRETVTRVGWIVMGIWPMLVVFAGGLVWFRRRGR